MIVHGQRVRTDFEASDGRRAVLVVVPTLNEAATISAVIDQLSFDLTPDWCVRFVVADGGSTDGTQAIVEGICAARSDVVLVNNPRRIQSAAVNLAVRLQGAGVEYLVRCDAHSSYPAGYVRRLVETADRVGADSVVVSLDSVGLNGLQQAVAWISDTRLGSGGSAHRGGRRSGYVDHGHHALVRLSSFERVGGYDESFSHNEDAEFDCRLKAAGGSIYLNADVRVVYFPRSSFPKLWKQYFGYGMGRSRTARLHPGSLRARQVVVPGYLGLSLVGLAAQPVAPAFALPALIYLTVLAAASVLFAIRTSKVLGFLTGPAALTIHCAWAAGFVTGLLTVRATRWRPDSPSRRLTADEQA